MLLLMFLACCMANVGKGNQLMQAERYDEAAQQFRTALAQDRKLEEAHRNLAICDFQIRHYEESAKLFRDMLPGKDHVIATYYLGRIDLAAGKFDSAIARLASLKSRTPDLVDAQYFLGVAYSKRASYSQAVQTLHTYIAINPRDFRAHEWLARCLLKLHKPEAAKEEFRRTRELHEYYTTGSTLLEECRSLLSAGKSAQAWDKCGATSNTDDVDKLTAIGMLFGQMNDQPHALQAWQVAQQLDADSPELNYNLAFAYYQGRDIQHSRQYAARAYELWPDFPEASILYGTILFMTGPEAEARRVLTHAHDLRPDDTNVVQLLQALPPAQN